MPIFVYLRRFSTRFSRFRPGIANPTSAAVLILFALLAPSIGNAQQSAVTDGADLPRHSVVDQSDVASLEVNPAGLGFLNGSQFSASLAGEGKSLSGQLDEPSFDEYGLLLGGGTGRLGAAFGVQFVSRRMFGRPAPHDYRKYSLGLGTSSESSFSVGASFNFFGSGTYQSLDDLTSLDLGLQWRPTSFLGFGARVQNTNTPFLRPNSPVPVRYTLGGALRFLDGRVLLETEARFIRETDDLRIRPQLEVEPLAGISIYSAAGLDQNARDSGERFELNRVEVGLSTTFAGTTSQGAVGTRGGTENLNWVAGRATASSLMPKRRIGVQKTWTVINLDQSVRERPPTGFLAEDRTSFLELISTIEHLAAADDTAGLVLKIKNNSLGWSQVWELRQAIDRFKQTGKEVIAYLPSTSLKNTYLASGCSKTWLAPHSPFSPDGLQVRLESYKNLLQNMGIEAEFIRIGTHKSAPETYTHGKPSEPAVDQTRAYLDELFGRAVTGIADGSSNSKKAVEDAIDRVPLYPDEAISAGYASSTKYVDEIRTHLQDQSDAPIEIQRFKDVSRRRHTWGGRPVIAVVPITGMITGGESGKVPGFGGQTSGAESLSNTFKDLKTDPRVRAVVLRIDSPGGSAKASDEIYRAIRKLDAKKPVVASMGDVAASGGYYVAAGAREILAGPSTLTGSIGIFAGKFNFQRLAKKLGIDSFTLERGDRANPYSGYEGWSEQQKAGIEKTMRYLYELFLTQAAETRPLDGDEIDKVARGRIWTGRAAKNQKLVDRMGGLVDAIHRAESLADIDRGTATYKMYHKSQEVVDLNTTTSSEYTARVVEQLVPEGLLQSKKSRLGDYMENFLNVGIYLPLVFSPGEPLMLSSKALVCD